MALPAGAATATITVGVSTDIAGEAGTITGLAVRPECRLVWAATGQPIEDWDVGAIDAATATLVVLADQDGVVTSDTVAGAPALVAIRSWPMVAVWWVKSAGGQCRKIVRRFPASLLAAGGTLDLDLRKPIHLERIKKTMAEARRSAQTIRHVLAALRQVFNFAKRHGLYAGDNPVSLVKKPSADARRLRFLTHDEADRLLAALAERESLVSQTRQPLQHPALGRHGDPDIHNRWIGGRVHLFQGRLQIAQAGSRRGRLRYRRHTLRARRCTA